MAGRLAERGFGSLRDIADADPTELAKVKGLSPERAEDLPVEAERLYLLDGKNTRRGSKTRREVIDYLVKDLSTQLLEDLEEGCRAIGVTRAALKRKLGVSQEFMDALFEQGDWATVQTIVHVALVAGLKPVLRLEPIEPEIIKPLGEARDAPL